MNISRILVGGTLVVSGFIYTITGAVESLPYTPIPTILPAPLGNTILQAQSAETTLPAPHEESLLLQASTIMGHIGVADIALLHEIYPEATANIKFALDATRDLIQETELFSSSHPVTLANLSYRSPKEERNFWLPLIGSHLVVRTMDGYFLNTKKPDIQVTDAEIVYYRIYLNVKTVLEKLEDAERALKNKSYKDAEFAIQEAIRGTFIDHFTLDDPFASIQDHLVLANELVKDRNYTSAALSLGHARSLIISFSTRLPGQNKQRKTLTALLADITDVQTHLFKASTNASSLDADNEKILDRWIHDFPEKFLSQ